MTLAVAAAAPIGRAPISVMVVDDSAVVRGMITRQIEAEPDMAVVASAANGAMALMELRRRSVDLIVLDLEMPVMNGLTALPQLLAARPGVKVLIASTLTRRNAEIGLQALHLGASDYLQKPDSLVGAEAFNRDLIGKLRALGGRSASSLPPAAPVYAPTAPRKTTPALAPSVIAIGGSTGAPPVLLKLFQGLIGHVRQPILVVQHMPPTFTAILAEQIGRAAARPAAEGRDGEPILDGRIYVAPGGWHMRAVREGAQALIRLDQTAPENFCRPAVDPMFRSVAEVFGDRVLALVLTGMGVDGAAGATRVREAGGRVAVQDEASSAVWGMPGAVAKAGLAERILGIDEMAGFLIQAAGGGR